MEAGWSRALERRIDEAFAEFGWRELGLYPVLWESAKRRMSSHLKRFVARDVAEMAGSGFRPARLEREFEAVVGGRLFRGRPDRVDLGPDGATFRVVDYKTRRGSWRGNLEKKVLGLSALQPPLYLELASHEFKGSAAGAFFYVLEQDPGADGRPMEFSGEAWKRWRDRVLEGVEALIRNIELGRFPIAPDEGVGGACVWCDFHWLCRKSHPATRRRASESKLRAELDEIRGHHT